MANRGEVRAVRGSVVGIRFDARADDQLRAARRSGRVKGLMGRMPSSLDYQPTTVTELSQLQERIANTDTGSITSIQAECVPADGFTDPAAMHTFSLLTASIVLSRKSAGEGSGHATSSPFQDGHPGSRWRAEKNIDELLTNLSGTFNQLRQSGMDEELFDVESGFEALSGRQRGR